MIYPSVNEMMKDKYNRYMLCIATAKCARIVTDKAGEQKDDAARSSKDDKSFNKALSEEEKPVQTAINLLYSDDFKIILPEGSSANGVEIKD